MDTPATRNNFKILERASNVGSNNTYWIQLFLISTTHSLITFSRLSTIDEHSGLERVTWQWWDKTYSCWTEASLTASEELEERYQEWSQKNNNKEEAE